MQSKTLTIMFADVQGYTSRTGSQTREENQTFVREVRQFVEKHVADKGGKLVKAMGDGFLMTFESPTDAVACGLTMQREMEKRNSNMLNTDNFVRFRIGISTGEVNIDDQADVYGDAVNIAARIEKFTEPNEVFISEATYLAMNKSEIKALDLGPQKFKNVLEEIRVYKILKDEPSARLVGFKANPQSIIITAAVALTILLIGWIIAKRSAKPAAGSAARGSPQETSSWPGSAPSTNPGATGSGGADDTASKNTSDKMRREKEVSRLLENNQFEEALLLAEQYLKNDPDNPRLLEQAARAYTEMGDLTRAKDYLEKVIKADQDASEPYRQLAAIYERQSDLPEAMNMLRVYSLKEQNYLPREKAKRRIKDLERMQRKSDMQKAAAQAQANRAASQAASPKPEPAAPEKPKTETPAANPARPPSRAIEVPRPVGDLKAITTGRYDTSKMPPAQRLCCAQYFSDQADNIRALDPAGADFLYAQADKVRLGQMADVECKCP